jgi:UDP:flavonoid glycosyltransferase YjiC (YdhE family)
MVGNRLEDLKLGKVIKPLELTPAKLRSAMIEIMNDDSYVERMVAFSKTSKQYDGNKNSSAVIAEVLKKSENKKDK